MTDATLSIAPPARHPLLWPAMAALLIFGWSSGFVGVRYASQEASATLLLFWRTLLSGGILLPFALLIGPRLRARAVLAQMAFGVMSVFIYLGGFSVAIQGGVPTGLVALISDLLPLAIAVLSQPLLAERLTPTQWTGTATAVIGVLIVSLDSLTVGDAPLWAYGTTVGSMLIFAFASVLYRGRASLKMPVHQALCIQSLTGSALFAAATWASGQSLMPPMTPTFGFGMAWLVFAGTFLAYSVYYTSLRLFPAAKVSAAIYLSPPVTMIWAWALFGEPLTLTMFAGLLVTMAGVWMTQR